MKYAILALFFLASYAMAAAPPTNPLTITYKEAGKTFFVETGDTVVVDLFSQPGEGQFWCLKKVEGKAIKLDRFTWKYDSILEDAKIEMRVVVLGRGRNCVGNGYRAGDESDGWERPGTVGLTTNILISCMAG